MPDRSALTPDVFIKQYLPQLKSVRLPKCCVISLVPHLERFFPAESGRSFSLLFQSNMILFDEYPFPYSVLYAGMGAPVQVNAVVSQECPRLQRSFGWFRSGRKGVACGSAAANL